MPEPTRRPTLALVVDNAISARLLELHTGLPGQVVSFDAAKQRADVRPMVRALELQEDGTRKPVELPVLPDVPIVFPKFGAYGLELPVTAGDVVWLEFSEAAFDLWIQNGQISDPGDTRRHALADVIARAGPRPNSRPILDYDTAHVTLGKEGMPAMFVALADKVATELALFNTALASAIATFTAGLPATAPSQAALLALQTALTSAGWPHSTASTTVKIKG